MASHGGISTHSVSIDLSPKHDLPTDFSITQEAQAKQQRFSLEFQDDLPSRFHKIVGEFVGTYILMFAGCGAALVNQVEPLTVVGIGLVWGMVLMAVIYALGHISGAHFNPAVTIAFAVSRKFPWKHVPMYVITQLLGATAACLTLKVLFNERNTVDPMTTRYSSPTSDLEAITWEFIITFILMFVICGAAIDHRAIKELSGVAIGGTLMFNVIIAGPITGASMNPARSIGPALVTGFYRNLWVYTVAPIVGAIAAAMVYYVLLPRKPRRSEYIIAKEMFEGRTKRVQNDLYSESDP